MCDNQSIILQEYRNKLLYFFQNCHKTIQMRKETTIYNGGRLNPIMFYIHKIDYSDFEINKFFPTNHYSFVRPDLVLYQDIDKKQPFIFFQISGLSMYDIYPKDKIIWLKNKFNGLRIFEIGTDTVDRLIEQLDNNKQYYQLIIDREITSSSFV
jgi:hypothetical protein